MFKSKLKLLSNPLILFSVFGIMGATIFVYLQEPGIPDLTQTIANISPFLVLILAIEIFPLVKKQNILFTILITCAILNLSFFKFFPKYNSGFAGRKNIHSEIFTSKVESYLKDYQGKFIHCSIRNNFTLNSRNDFHLNRWWWYDMVNEFNFILISPKTRMSIELAPLFENSLNEFCNTPSNKYYKSPICYWFNDIPINIKNIVSVLKKNKINHFYIENSNKIDKAFLSHLTLICQDNITGASFWKFKD